MIHFLARERDPFLGFIDNWAPDLRPRVRVIPHYRIPFVRALPPGAWIFSDFERMRSWRRARAKQLADRLRRVGDGRVLLNDPDRYIGRFQLMRLLHGRGINDFRAFRLDELDSNVRFPVFLRSAVDHRGAISGLLSSPDEVRRALSRLSLRNRLRRKHLMIVEYCDCADAQGMFRKYSAMNVHGTLVPRHVLFSRDWVTKHPDLVSDAGVAEENEFVEQFPHAAQLSEIFRLAGIDYGRIDYGVKDGRIQVWEINTNPIVVPWRDRIHAKRLVSQTVSAQRIAAAVTGLA